MPTKNDRQVVNMIKDEEQQQQQQQQQQQL